MKNKGYTLMELMVVVAIIMGLSGVVGLSVGKYLEQRDEKIVTYDLPMLMETMALHADNTNERVYIEFDYNNNLILFKKNSKIIEKFRLPKRYKYSDTVSTSIHFTEEGNISRMFSFKIKDEKGKEFYKLTFTSTDKFVRSVRVNRYFYVNNDWVEVT